jgi:hypothetical protein
MGGIDHRESMSKSHTFSGAIDSRGLKREESGSTDTVYTLVTKYLYIQIDSPHSKGSVSRDDPGMLRLLCESVEIDLLNQKN